jgi:hypothetical protein
VKYSQAFQTPYESHIKVNVPISEYTTRTQQSEELGTSEKLKQGYLGHNLNPNSAVSRQEVAE